MNAASPNTITGLMTAGPTANQSLGRVVMRASGLRKAFDGEAVLAHVDLCLREGEVVLLRGDNGSGKTTLLNILTGNLEPDAGSIRLHGERRDETFRFPLKPRQRLNPFNHFVPERVAQEAVGRAWQDVRLFRTRSLLDNVAVAKMGQLGENPFNVIARPLAVRSAEGVNRAESVALLADMGLPGRAHSTAANISLGQTKRVAIGRALRAGARILFLDEPLAGLDAAGAEHMLAMLSSLARKDRVTLVIVEHVFNTRRILDLADTVWTLKEGLLEPLPAADAAMERQPGNALHTLLECLSGTATLTERHSLGGLAELVKVRRPGASTDALLKLEDLFVHRNGRAVIGLSDDAPGLTFDIAPGEVGILCAPNGWGKTTLLEAIAGIVAPTAGTIRFEGTDSSKLAIWDRVRRGMRFVPARTTLFPGLSIAEFAHLSGVAFASENYPISSKRLVGSLSGGERQDLALRGTSQACLLLLDEPFLGLDSTAIDRACFQLRSFMEGGTQAILIALPASIDGSQTTLYS